MKQNELIQLIWNGESRSVDFKRELKLETKKQRSELIKDVNSLANSTSNIGNLIIGVSDNKDLIGCEKLPEEQIQQILHRYIRPSIEIDIYNLEIDHKNISTISIKPTKKPHEVIWEIDKIEQYTVFVRHGSIIKKATPEEIISMSGQGLNSPIDKILGLTDTDNLVLKLSAEYSLSKNNISVDLGAITQTTNSLNISKSEIIESIEVLGRKGYLDISNLIHPPSYTVSMKGLEEYAQLYFPDYDGLQNSVISLLVKDTSAIIFSEDIAKQLNKSQIIIDLIYSLLESKDYIEIRRFDGIGLAADNISPELKRKAMNISSNNGSE